MLFYGRARGARTHLRTLSRIVPYRTAFVPLAPVPIMPPICAPLYTRDRRRSTRFSWSDACAGSAESDVRCWIDGEEERDPSFFQLRIQSVVRDAGLDDRVQVLRCEQDLGQNMHGQEGVRNAR